eukprot:gene28854-37862_t
MDMESDEFRPPPASTLRLGDTSFENLVNLLQQYLERISREKEMEFHELNETLEFIVHISHVIAEKDLKLTELKKECDSWKNVAIYGAATRNTKVFPPRRGDAIESVGAILTRGYAACRVFNGKATKHPRTVQVQPDVISTPKAGLSSSTSRELFALFHSQEVECPPTLPAFITATIPIEPVIIHYAIDERSTPAIVATKIHQAIEILRVDAPGVHWIKDSTLDVQDSSGKLVFESKPDGGCWSYVGTTRKYSGNIINIDPNWTVGEPGQGPSIGTILHELLHTLGVAHEHERSDRHAYVEVVAGFLTQSNATVHPFRYDYASIMHYPSGAGLNPSPQAWAIVGQRECLSPLDKLFINWLYPAPKQEGIYEPKMSMQTGLWYCGRRVMEKHNLPDPMVGCDGYCGPSVGPNCPTCIIYGVGCGNSFPLQRINQGGIVSIQGETGLFYCGRVMERGGGNCGPDHGPNCVECHNYLE